MDTKKLIDELKKEIAGAKLKVRAEETGRVLLVKDGVIRISGLYSTGALEMLIVRAHEGEVSAMALNLDADQVGAIVLGDWEKINEGDEVVGTGKILSVPVGDTFLGRVVNPLGEPLDGKGPIKASKYNPLERIAPGVVTRKSVDTSLATGIKAIDAMIPIGRGQRELIIGDRQTGKTAIAVDAVLNQKNTGVKSIYVAIGQKMSRVVKIVTELEKRGALDNTIVVVASASDPAAFSYIAPYAGCAMGEYFMDQGKDALVVYDDLSRHAWAYRQVSLLLERSPGREAYPGDVFYLHSRLLERAARMSKEYGGGSLTALPIIETQTGDISAYIPTNVISITDGQIYLESELFYQGIRPALNVGLSVSRVGSAAQTKAMKKVAGKLRLDLAQYRELAVFAQFAQDLDEATKKQLERGKRLTELLKQGQYAPASMEEQVVVLYAGVNGHLDTIAPDKVRDWESGFIEYLKRQNEKILTNIRDTKNLDDETESAVKQAIEDYNKII
ncbi:MAG: F0F1 ATP synthase subunit alpha [Candidatus Terrybacteria bacterium RIFCSPLOWO2_01_FULL_44_24]|uniref:ATP synthase subunit alpha n=1 Tax=Candidatus Terrybacteria bacterium RIFCSPHIGHO2_01_FULL_43_35 TaxID=1802361 RepID=A0A1G2PDM0_9BACT|nr:MAG: F0F1 ATP synthase subunit alpha [Candidatus Terrybacteria bacterium RIFCSPHIGHO2_01_FULL_43_35]OHA49776.1 MAG: F0F1 ATP synthase subunit alpha [Candidatus Terrybacteria bacterium RIFCSPHIGHO2_02_FULL_43_14]OHA51598.1 MAG: F0F1 ATP synthase subunit alpha [Candidatus Terrybacteria bacterium RIFCSPLOWO2_01_FULL_44_24]